MTSSVTTQQKPVGSETTVCQGVQKGYYDDHEGTVRQVVPGKRGTAPAFDLSSFSATERKTSERSSQGKRVKLMQNFVKRFATVTSQPLTIGTIRRPYYGFPHRMSPRVRE